MQPIPVVKSTSLTPTASAKNAGGSGFAELLSQQLAGPSGLPPTQSVGSGHGASPDGKTGSSQGGGSSPSSAASAGQPALSSASNKPVSGSGDGTVSVARQGATASGQNPASSGAESQSATKPILPSVATPATATQSAASVMLASTSSSSVGQGTANLESQETTKKPQDPASAQQAAVAGYIPAAAWMVPAYAAGPSGSGALAKGPAPQVAGGVAGFGSSSGQGQQGEKSATFPPADGTALPAGASSAAIATALTAAAGTEGLTTAQVEPGTTEGHKPALAAPSAGNPLAWSALTLSSTAPATTSSMALATPLGSTVAWGQELGQKVTWMIAQNQSSAELQLNPPGLGPMTVVVQVAGNQANAFFSSPHAAVRDAIQQALPHLAEQLASSGLMLGQSSVSDQRGGSQGGGGHSSYRWGETTASRNNVTEVSSGLSASVPKATQIRTGLVDTFA